MEAVIPRRGRSPTFHRVFVQPRMARGCHGCVPQLIQLTGVAHWDLKSGTEAKSLNCSLGNTPSPALLPTSTPYRAEEKHNKP